MSDHKSAALLLPALPAAREVIAGRGFDSNCFRIALAERRIIPWIPPTCCEDRLARRSSFGYVS